MSNFMWFDVYDYLPFPSEVIAVNWLRKLENGKTKVSIDTTVGLHLAEMDSEEVSSCLFEYIERGIEVPLDKSIKRSIIDMLSVDERLELNGLLKKETLENHERERIYFLSKKQDEYFKQ